MAASERIDVLAAELNEAQVYLDACIADLAELTEEGKRRFPRGFTGNGVPGEFESWEAEWSEAEQGVRDARKDVEDARAALARVQGGAL